MPDPGSMLEERAQRRYPLLFSPFRIGSVGLRNRVILSPMTTGFGFTEGRPDDDMAAYLRARSAGIGMTVVAFGAVMPRGRVEQLLPWMWLDDASHSLESLVGAIHETGAAACLQLGHGGRQVSPAVIGQAPVAPSGVPPAVHVKVPPEELTTGEVEEIVEAFGAAAAKASRAGFDAIELHAGHGYLPHQFLSAEANRRTDRYGGETVAARARFGVEVLEAIREESPGLAVVVRINGSDLTPDGSTPGDAVEAARAFEAAGADAIVVSAGVYGSVPYTIPMLDDPPASFVSLARHLRSQIRVPVVAVGGFERPVTAEAALRGGACDAIAVGRALLADPEWALKAAAGRTEEIRPCIGTVDACAGMLEHGEPISCAVNPEVGRERRAAAHRPARAATVAVVGAGPGGLEAGCRAAELGQRVVIFEQSPAIGGALRLAALTPPLHAVRRLVGWLERRARAADVELRTGTRADLAGLAELEPDLVVSAPGASRELPVLDGYELLPSWPLEDLLRGAPSSLETSMRPSRPVIFGHGRDAIATALWFAESGAEPTLLSRDRLGSDASGLVRRALRSRLDRVGVRQVRGVPLALAEDGVRWCGEAGEGFVEADGFVIADRRLPTRVPELDELDAEVVRVGDGREPRDIVSAIAEGREGADAFARQISPTAEASA